jgi:phage tail protein X
MATVLRHLTTRGERWDTLAQLYYHDATRYAPIIAANPGVPLFPALPAGLTIAIPVLPPVPTPAERLPPWIAAVVAAGALQ